MGSTDLLIEGENNEFEYELNFELQIISCLVKVDLKSVLRLLLIVSYS